MQRIQRTIVRFIAVPVLITCGLLALLFSAMPTTPTARAGDPTLDAAMQVIWQATRSVQQTRDAREAELASQRATAAAIENAQRQAALEATRSAYATRLAVEATATRQAMDAQATRERQQAEATATMEAIRAEEMRTIATTTAVMANLHAQATRTALARQQETEQRNALLTSLGIGASTLVVILIALAIGRSAVNVLQMVGAKYFSSRPPVVIVEEHHAEPVPASPSSPPLTQVVPFDENVARATLDLIAQQIHDDTNPELTSTE